MLKYDTPIEPIKNPMKAIRAFCLGCVGGSARDVKECTAPGCPLYAWRFGKRPAEFISDRKREAARANAAKMLAARLQNTDTNSDEN